MKTALLFAAITASTLGLTTGAAHADNKKHLYVNINAAPAYRVAAPAYGYGHGYQYRPHYVNHGNRTAMVMTAIAIMAIIVGIGTMVAGLHRL
jgi:hypothetical protein